MPLPHIKQIHPKLYPDCYCQLGKGLKLEQGHPIPLVFNQVNTWHQRFQELQDGGWIFFPIFPLIKSLSLPFWPQLKGCLDKFTKEG